MGEPVDVSDRRRVPLTVRRAILVRVVLTAAAITLGPLPVSILDTTHDVVRWMVSLIPDAPVGRPSRTETEAMLNVAAPLVIVCAVVWALPATRTRTILAAGVASSVLVETVQLVLPSRHPEIRDVVLNTIGVSLGALLVAMARRRLAGQHVAAHP